MKEVQVAVPTAFHADESLHCEATVQHMMHLYDQGIRSILVCGTTGEQHSLRLEEKKTLLDYINQYPFPDDMEIIFGVSSTRQLHAVELASDIAESTKVSGILLGFPPYIIPTQADVMQYCHAIIDAARGTSILLYNNPMRTGFDVQVETVLKILQHPNVVGIKEAGDPNKVQVLLERIDRDVLVFYGGDANIPEAVNKGYNALSSIAANIYPQEIQAYFHQLKNKMEIDKDVQAKINELYSKPLLPYIKKLISENEQIDFGRCRLPLGADMA